MNPKNYYQLLQISPDASENDIKKAYRKLALVFHPDVNTKKNAEEQFKILNEAYAVLSDRHKRQIYDQTGCTDFSANGDPVNRSSHHTRSHHLGGMERCMGKCSGLEALFRRRPRKKSAAPDARLN